MAQSPGVSGSNNLIVGNLIGTNAAGSAALGNNNGITILGDGFNIQTKQFFDVPNRNVIGAGGIFVTGSTGTLIGGNNIGTNAAGIAPVPNTTAGMTSMKHLIRSSATSAS